MHVKLLGNKTELATQDEQLTAVLVQTRQVGSQSIHMNVLIPVVKAGQARVQRNEEA